MKKPQIVEGDATEWWTDANGRRVRLLFATADHDVYEIVEDNEGENAFRKERVKQMKVSKKTHAVEEKWEYIDESGNLHIRRTYDDDERQLINED